MVNFFKSRCQCKSARANFFCYFYDYVNVDLYVVISEKKDFTEYERGYVYTTEQKYVIRKSCLS